MSFSVIIPTKNSHDTLELTLSQLYKQTKPAYEIIVADGCSSDRTREISASFGAIVVDNPVIHAAGGRNRGAAIAQGEWLAFTDSDCCPPVDWLQTATRVIQEYPQVVAIGGPVKAYPPRNEIENVAADALLHGVLQYPAYQQVISERTLRGAFITANVFYQHNIFHQVDGFDEFFANYGEDIDLFWRVLDVYAGRLVYEPNLWMEHSFPNTWLELFRKWHQYGLASCYLQRKHLGRFHIDTAHYRRLLVVLSQLTTQKQQRRCRTAQFLQIFAHLLGKYHGSLKLGIVNL